MSLSILSKIHPLVETAWLLGLDLVIEYKRVVVKDLFVFTDKDTEERRRGKKGIEANIQKQEKEVRAYLESLSKLQVKIDSEILNDQVWIVGTKALLKKLPKNQVGYFPAEVMLIKKAQWSPDTLKKMHQIKKLMGGTIVDIQKHMNPS